MKIVYFNGGKDYPYCLFTTADLKPMHKPKRSTVIKNKILRKKIKKER